MATEKKVFRFNISQIYNALRKEYHIPAQKSVRTIKKVGCDDELGWYESIVITTNEKIMRKKT